MKTRVLYPLAWALVLQVGCHSPAPEDVSHSDSPGAHEILKENGLATGYIRDRVIARAHTATGRIEAPPQSMAQVYPTLGAFVEEVYVLQGREVERGERLAALRHPDINEIQQRYLRVSQETERSRQDYLRKQELSESEAISVRELQQARAQYLSARGELTSLASSLRSLGIAPDRLERDGLVERVFLTAPISGHVQETRAGVGQYAGTDQPLFSIVSKHHLHLEIRVSPGHIDDIRPGQRVYFHTSTGKQGYQAEVFLVNQVADASGFFNVHAHFADSLQHLHPGSFAEVKIIYQSDTLPALPRTALHRADGRTWVVTVHEDHFEPLAVATGAHSDSLVAILNADDLRDREIVLSGARYLLHEEKEGGHSH